ALARQRFLREARVAAPIHHPNVCLIYDVGELKGFPYVVMAYVEGGTLADQLGKSRRLDSRQAAAWASQIAQGLAKLHEHNVIHRDSKPGNVLIDKTGHAVLTDFGLARPDADADHLTEEGAVVGTMAYMAPEQ